MLETMRNQAQSWIAKIILMGIALSFALWGVGDYFMDSNIDSVAEIDGKKISARSFQNVYNQQLNNYRSMLGQSFSKEMADNLGLKETTLQTMINRKLMLDEAEEQGLVGPTTTLLARIQATPAFQSAEGSFDAARYHALTRNLGFRSPVDYEKDQQLNLMVEALERTLSESVSITEDEIYQRFLKQEERRDLTAVIVETDQLMGQIQLSDADALAYYEKNKSLFMSPTRLALVAIDINADNLLDLVELDDAKVKASYESMKDTWWTKEERRASHILVRVVPDAAEDVKQQAKDRINVALKRLQEGEAFELVAKEMSDDTTSSQGGDLGFFSKGRMVAAFEENVFSLEKGAISPVVSTDFGLHIIKLTDIREARQQSFAEVETQLRAKLRLEKAGEEAYQLSRELDDVLGQEDHLKDAAEVLDLALLTIGELSQQEAMANSLLNTDEDYRKQIFRSSPGDNIEIVEISTGRFVAVEILARIDPQVQDFSDVKEKVIAMAKQEKVQEASRMQAEALLDRVSTLADLKDHVSQSNFVAKSVKRDGTGDDQADWLNRVLLTQAFLLQEGEMAQEVFETSKGFALIQVNKVIAASQDEFALVHDELEQALRQDKGQARFERWMSSVRQRHDIQINTSILAKF